MAEHHDTELHKAANTGDTEEVEMLLKDGKIDINAQGAQGRTPLQRALGGGFTETAQLLITRNADPAIVDAMKRTSLHWAAKGPPSGAESHSCCMLLLNESRECFMSMLNMQSKSGSTPLHFALDSGHKESAALLVQNGANLDIVDDEGKTCTKLANEKGMKAVLKVKH